MPQAASTSHGEPPPVPPKDNSSRSHFVSDLYRTLTSLLQSSQTAPTTPPTTPVSCTTALTRTDPKTARHPNPPRLRSHSSASSRQDSAYHSHSITPSESWQPSDRQPSQLSQSSSIHFFVQFDISTGGKQLGRVRSKSFCVSRSSRYASPAAGRSESVTPQTTQPSDHDFTMRELLRAIKDRLVTQSPTTATRHVPKKDPCDDHLRAHQDRRTTTTTTTIGTDWNRPLPKEPQPGKGKLNTQHAPLVESSTTTTTTTTTKDDYQLDGCVLGSGAFSTVRLATHRASGRQVAIKIIEKERMKEYQTKLLSIYAEYELIRSLSATPNPWIVHYEDTFEDTEHVYLVMEFVPGGELFEFIERQEQVTEWEVRHIFREIVEAIAFLHQQHICHRDLKLENILLYHRQDDSTRPSIKIIDFGLATPFTPGEKLTLRCGSEEYACPEVILGNDYDGPNCDIWALGIILYALLTGQLPFSMNSRRPREMFHKICKGQFSFPANCAASEEAKDLVKQLLQPVVERRATLDQIKQHAWFHLHEEAR